MSTPVSLSRITPIPAAVVRRLRRFKIDNSGDLLRVNLTILQRKLKEAASLADVQRWRSIASLLELNGLELDAAIALANRNVGLAGDLHRRSLSSVRELFAAAVAAHEIKTQPDDDAIAALLVDSALLAATGVLNITVVGKGDKPVKGAVVSAARTSGTTDENGRVRLLRLPLGSAIAIQVQHRGSATATLEATPLASLVLSGVRVEIKKSGASKPHPKQLSEFAGDQLPERMGRPLHSEEQKGTRLRAGDLLRWYDTLKSGDVKLVSRFVEFDGERFLTRVWRVPAAMLPADSAQGDSFRVLGDKLVATTTSSLGLARARLARRIFRGVKRKSKRADADRQLRQLIAQYGRQTKTLRGL